MRTFAADFETTTDPDDCRVWAWATCEVGNTANLITGNSMETFMEWCEAHGKCKLYFHNLAFDGTFIMDWLLNNGWLWCETMSETTDYCFTTCISDMNQVYSIELVFRKGQVVTIYDSLKVIPLKVKQIPKAFGLDESKLEIDYKAYREPGHELTQEEIDYVSKDVVIVAKALKSFIDEGITKMTAASNALWQYKRMVGGEKSFRRCFPVLDSEVDKFCRKAYRGGWTYADPRYKGKKLGTGIVLDVNSLYPSVMAGCDGQLLPFGGAEWFDGYPEVTSRTPLWIACISFSFKLKPDHLPCIQLKGNNRFKSTEYLSDSQGVQVVTMTNVDWELVNKQYDVSNVEFLGGYSFRGTDTSFKSYVDHWTKVKIESGKNGNLGMRQIAKLMLNSLYGKFATRIEVCSRRPELDNGIVKYVDMEPTERKPVYLPVGIFVTAYGRYKTVTSAQAEYDRFVYSDTDSIHLLGENEPEGLELDDYELGKWAHESTFTEAKFLGAKCYVEHEIGKDKLTVHVAGMPDTCHDQVTIDNFEYGLRYDNVLVRKRVKGGTVLLDGFKEIKPR